MRLKTAIVATAATLFACLQLVGAADKYKISPFTGKLDNVGDAAIQSGYSTAQKVFKAYTGIGRFESSYATDNHVPSGFISHDTSTVSFQNRTTGFSVTIAPTGTSFPIYANGTKYLSIGGTSTANPADSGRYYIYYNPDGTFNTTATTDEWGLESGSEWGGSAFDGAVPVAMLYWDALTGSGYLEDERHHSWRDTHWHHWAHHSIGSRYVAHHNADGLALSSANNYATSFAVSEGDIYDEDNRHNIPATDRCSIWYRNATGGMTFTRDNLVPYKTTGGVIQYDDGDGTPAVISGTGNFAVMWMYATNAYPSETNRIAVIMGQGEYTTLALARTAAFPTLPTGFVVEWKLIHKLIFKKATPSTTAWVENQDYRTVSSLPAGQIATSNIAATSVTYSPTSPDTSINVQTALEARALERQQATFGNVSVSEISASGKAVIKGTLDASTTTGNLLFLRGSTTYGYSSVFFTGNGISNWLYSFGSTYALNDASAYNRGAFSFESSGIGGLNLATTHASGAIKFHTNGVSSERMRIAADGNVSINTALTTPTIQGGTLSGDELTLKGSSSDTSPVTISQGTVYGNISSNTIKAKTVPTWVPSVCGEDPLRPAVYDGAPGANAVFCNLSGGVRSVLYDTEGLNPSTLSPFAVHLFEGAAEVTPLYWSWVTGGASNRIYGSGTESTFTPSVKPTFSAYSSNNYVQVFVTYSSLYGRRTASCGTPISVARLFKGYSGAQGTDGTDGTDGITWDFVVGSVTKLAAGETPFVTYSTSGATEKTVNYGLVTGDTGSAASITESAVIDAFQASTSDDYFRLKATSGDPEKLRIYDASDNVRLEITSSGLIVVKDASGNARFGFDTTSNSLYMKRGATTVFSVSSTGRLTL